MEAVGCLGRVINHERLKDGRYKYLLVGLRRVRLHKELVVPTLYRQAAGDLMDEIERELHPAVNLATLNVLLADREASKVRLAELAQLHAALQAQYEALAKEHAVRIAESGGERELGLRSESTYLNIIGGLLTLLLGKSPAGKSYSSFQNMDAVVSALLAHHEGRPGISERTLWSKLAQARRHLEASR